jgi:hypothetical protein
VIGHRFKKKSPENWAAVKSLAPLKNLAGESQSAIGALPTLLAIPAVALVAPPTENVRQFSVSRVLTGSAATPMSK